MGVLDTAGDLLHRAADIVTGNVAKPSPPNKPPYRHMDVSPVLGGAAEQAGDNLRNRKSAIDKAVDDAS